MWNKFCHEQWQYDRNSRSMQALFKALNVESLFIENWYCEICGIQMSWGQDFWKVVFQPLDSLWLLCLNLERVQK